MHRHETATAVVKNGRLQPLLYHHPWVYADSIEDFPAPPPAGGIVRVTAPNGRFIGWGLHSPASVIRIRLYSFNENTPITTGFFYERLVAAKEHRRPLIRGATNVFRLVFGEGDDFPGLVVDRYGEFLAVTFTTAAIAAYSAEILDLLEALYAPRGIVARKDPNIEALEGFQHPEGTLRGLNPSQIEVLESDIRYSVVVDSTQRKMLYLDQRENRLAVAGLAEGDMLDLFCYNGGFSLNALKHGLVERSVCVDSSGAALRHLEENAILNDFSDRITPVKADCVNVMKQLRSDRKRFNTIVLDPPKLVHKRAALRRGLKKYEYLNELALSLAGENCLFVSCSCSGAVSRSDLLRVISTASVRANRRVRLIEMRGAAPCHPVSPCCPEGEYLKCAILRVE